MERIQEIETRNKRHKQLREFGRSPASSVSSNKEIDTLMFELKHIHDAVPDDIEYLLAVNKRLTDKLKEVEEDIDYLNRLRNVGKDETNRILAENKRLTEVLKKINHRATAYSNQEVPAIVLNEIREMSGYATNQFIDHQAREEGK